jgi:hypothetical protein
MALKLSQKIVKKIKSGVDFFNFGILVIAHVYKNDFLWWRDSSVGRAED